MNVQKTPFYPKGMLNMPNATLLPYETLLLHVHLASSTFLLNKINRYYIIVVKQLFESKFEKNSFRKHPTPRLKYLSTYECHHSFNLN